MIDLPRQFKFLKAFCSTDELRMTLWEPFTQEGWSYATDGAIIVRIPAIPEITEKCSYNCGALNWSEAERVTPLPTLPERGWLPCPEMEEFGMTTCRKTCQECLGTGRVPTKQRITIGERDFNSEYLRLMKMFLRNVKTNLPTAGEKMLRFTFEGGEGLLMALAPENPGITHTRKR